MKLLKIIKDSDPDSEESVKYREGARAILFDENRMVPLLFVSKFNYHKLPGGGIESGEDQLQALSRESMEEIGCEISVEGEVGKIIEFRSIQNLRQTNYCFFGKILSKGNPNFTAKEIEQGFQIVWMTLDNAINTIETDEPDCYEGIFIQKRELIFLKSFVRSMSPPVVENGPSVDAQRRHKIRPGIKVSIVLKKDQPTGKLTEGIVQDILTNASTHPRGIKVRLTTGQVGRVQIIK